VSRDSKIGLLVATTFILVVGLLLSDHVTVANREPEAELVRRADDVRSGLTTPGNVPAPVLPTPTPVAVEPVEVKPFVDPAGETIVVQPVTDAWENEPEATPEPIVEPRIVPVELAALAQQVGETLEPVEAVPPQPVPMIQPVEVKAYVAQPGDSLSRIAARVFGRNTEEARQKIIALNPSLADNPDLIVVGRSYRLPSDAKEASIVTPVRVAKTYTVQSGDSLWRIAQRHLGDGNRGDEIARLNRDVLDNPDALQVGMTLRLPS
jgi:nucleoid-associated protein YgaU